MTAGRLATAESIGRAIIGISTEPALLSLWWEATSVWGTLGLPGRGVGRGAGRASLPTPPPTGGGEAERGGCAGSAGRASLPTPPPTGGGEAGRGGCAGRGAVIRWITALIFCPRGLPHLSQVISIFLPKLAIRGANLPVKREKCEEAAEGEGDARGPRVHAAWCVFTSRVARAAGAWQC